MRIDRLHAGYIDVKGIDTEELIATITGSGTVDLWGVSNIAYYAITGSGTIKAHNVESNNCTAEISGSGEIWCHAEEKLNVNISGVGVIYYRGDANPNANISGTGRLERIP